jgi:FkbM family methyltransferase
MRARRVFLDVGGHDGETLGAVMAPRWEFDRIWTFEPASACLPKLEALADQRVTVVPAGMWSSDCTMALSDPGTRHASVERRPWHKGTETCPFVDAARWMTENIATDDQVWMKVNIEAAEVEVLTRLLATNEIAKIDHLVVHFDVENIGMGDKAIPVRARLDEAQVPWREARDVMFGRTVAAKTETWLYWTQGHRYKFQQRRVQHLARRAVWKARKSMQRA